MCVELEQFFWANFGLGAMLFLRLVTKHIPQQFPIQFQPFCARSLALLLSLSLATSLLSAGHVFTWPVLALACYFRLGHLIWFFLVTVFGYGLTKTTACSTLYVCRCVCVSVCVNCLLIVFGPVVCLLSPQQQQHVLLRLPHCWQCL